MIAMGIDPGTRRIGYGVVEAEGNNVKLLAAGILPIYSGEDQAALVEAKNEMDSLCEKYSPDIVGVEKLFFVRNQKTGIAVAQARGVILLCAKEHGIPIKEYAPSEVKLGVTGYGSADKKAVLKMVRLILNEKDLEVIDDASDALALAILSSRERFPQFDSSR